MKRFFEQASGDLDALVEDFRDGAVSRREFIRRGAALGFMASSLAAIAAAPAAGQGAVKRGGKSIWSLPGNPVAINPIESPGGLTRDTIYDTVYESLFRYDKAFNLVPALAVKHENPNPTTWRFPPATGRQVPPRPRARFRGHRLLAQEPVRPRHHRAPQDLLFQRQGGGGAGTSTRWSSVSAIHWGRCSGTSDSCSAPASCRATGATPCPTSSCTRSAPGPSRSRSSSRPATSSTSATRDYWDDPLPYLDEVFLRILPDEETRIGGLRTGSLQYANLTPDGSRRLAGNKNVQVIRTQSSLVYTHMFNTRKPPFDDIRVAEGHRPLRSTARR